MALNTSKCNCLTPLHFKGLTSVIRYELLVQQLQAVTEFILTQLMKVQLSNWLCTRVNLTVQCGANDLHRTWQKSRVKNSSTLQDVAIMGNN